MRAGEVEDARLKGLYALQAGQTAGQLIRWYTEYVGNIYS